MSKYLLLVTVDGFGKPLAVSEIRRTRRQILGVKVSSAPIAFAPVRSTAR